MTPTWGIRAYTGEFYLVIFSKNEKIFQKSMFYGLFCSKFCTDHFSAVHFGPSGPTYAKNSKNRQKLAAIDDFAAVFAILCVGGT